MKPNMSTINELLKLRGVLQIIGQESFNYSTLNRQYPMAEIVEEDAKQLLTTYKDIIKRVKTTIDEYESDHGGTHENN